MPGGNNKIDSNVVGLSYAEEVELKVLPDNVPDSGDQEGGVWFALEPNEYEDFGGEVETVSRNPINASRQRRKGVVTDIEADGGITQDLTQRNLQRIMQGFMFADVRESVSAEPLSGATAKTITPTAFTATNIQLSAGDGANYAVGMLLRITGATSASNNHDVTRITAIAADDLTTSDGYNAEAFPAVDANIEIVGIQAADSDFGINVPGNGTVELTTAGLDFTDSKYNLHVGQWIFIGGDAAATRFDNNAAGYARIISVQATKLVLNECTWATPTTEAGAGGKTIQIFFGSFLRNEKDTALIKCRSYQLERTLGNDGNGTQSEYLVGAIANEFTLNVTAADKIECDLSFVALNNDTRTGTQGLKPGTRRDLLIEDAFNTSVNVYAQRLFVHDDNAVQPSSLFEFVEEATITVNNNVEGLKAIGVTGSFDINVGDFEVGGELDIYFATVEAVRAVKNNADLGYNLIIAANNAGMVYDIPLLSLGNARVNVEADNPVKLPVEKQASENAYGYTMSISYFHYLPTVAIPVAT